ncbi:hypothetical protein ACLOJK_011492 [Asimina triloba]
MVEGQDDPKHFCKAVFAFPALDAESKILPNESKCLPCDAILLLDSHPAMIVRISSSTVLVTSLRIWTVEIVVLCCHIRISRDCRHAWISVKKSLPSSRVVNFVRLQLSTVLSTDFYFRH